MVSVASATQVPDEELLDDEEDEDDELDEDELDEDELLLDPEPLELLELSSPPPQAATVAAVPALARNASARRRPMWRSAIVRRSWDNPRS